MNKYSEMGDASIAQKVWTCLGAKGQPPCDGPYGVSNGKMLHLKDGVWVAFDPCNSWADAGPIISGNKINLNSIQQGWVASDNGGHDANYYAHENPIRAAMIVFLMIQEASNEC